VGIGHGVDRNHVRLEFGQRRLKVIEALGPLQGLGQFDIVDVAGTAPRPVKSAVPFLGRGVAPSHVAQADNPNAQSAHGLKPF